MAEVWKKFRVDFIQWSRVLYVAKARHDFYSWITEPVSRGESRMRTMSGSELVVLRSRSGVLPALIHVIRGVQGTGGKSAQAHVEYAPHETA